MQMLPSVKTGQAVFVPTLILALATGCGAAGAASTKAVTVTVDSATIEFITSNGDMVPEPLETFLVTGAVTGYNGDAATGRFICWGMFTRGEAGTPAGFTAVVQRLQVDGRGMFVFTGAEMSPLPMAVIGGTGTFRGGAATYTVPAMADGADLDGDGEPELNSAPLGIDVDGDGNNDGTGHFEFTIDLTTAGT